MNDLIRAQIVIDEHEKRQRRNKWPAENEQTVVHTPDHESSSWTAGKISELEAALAEAVSQVRFWTTQANQYESALTECQGKCERLSAPVSQSEFNAQAIRSDLCHERELCTAIIAARKSQL